MLSAILDPATLKTLSHTQGVEKVASSCMPRSPWLIRKSRMWLKPPARYVPRPTTAVTPTPAATICSRFFEAMIMGASTAAGHTLIHVAMLSRTEATTGLWAAQINAINTMGAVMPSTRAKLRYPMNTVKNSHHHAGAIPVTRRGPRVRYQRPNGVEGRDSQGPHQQVEIRTGNACQEDGNLGQHGVDPGADFPAEILRVVALHGPLPVLLSVAEGVATEEEGRHPAQEVEVDRGESPPHAGRAGEPPNNGRRQDPAADSDQPVEERR